MNDEHRWKQVYDLIFDCGRIHEPWKFAVNLLEELLVLVPANQARLYMLNSNGKLQNQYLKGISKKEVAAYHEYYSQIEQEKYHYPVYFYMQMNPYCPDTVFGIRDWTKAADDEFKRDYVDHLGLKYSLGFTLFDEKMNGRLYYMLDRTENKPFSENEKWIVSMTVPVLNNTFKNFLYAGEMQRKSSVDLPEIATLTNRELEIMELLNEGISTKNIGKRLHIAQSTLYKHIAHIYAKMHVSTRQELMAKLSRR